MHEGRPARVVAIEHLVVSFQMLFVAIEWEIIGMVQIVSQTMPWTAIQKEQAQTKNFDRELFCGCKDA
jgi:hypothetical protein